MADETLAERDARLHAWLAGVKPGDIVTVRLNSTDTLTGKVYEAPDTRGTSLCVNTTVLRHGNGYPGGSFEPVVAAAPEDHIPALRALWRELAEKGIEFGVDWPYIVKTLFRDIDDLTAERDRLRGESNVG